MDVAASRGVRTGPKRSGDAPAGVAASASDVFEEIASGDLLKVPGTLYLAGEAAMLRGTKRVSVIGSRHPSAEGVRRARKLAAQLAEAGVIVISGLAMGIDRAAHEGALSVPAGRTIAVLGTPLDRSNPVGHWDLQCRIAREHLVVSQFREGSKVYPSNFVARNRTMALLSHVSVIVECGDTSGTLSQASETMRLGRRLFFMKSMLARTDLEWPGRFMKAGAEPLETVEQILAVLP
jgi:DNA processing protein